MSSGSFIKKEPDSAIELDDIARKLLSAADVGDKLPTPQEDIIQCAKLVSGGEIDLDDYKESFLKKARRVLFEGWDKVRGLLAVGDRTIYISSDVPESQRPFLNFHEVAHDVIPWQKEAYDLFADDKHSLSRKIEAGFDHEANVLSAKLLFQCDRFQKEARDYKLSIKTGIFLSDKYGTSKHSTLWEYVEKHGHSCILLILSECNYQIVCEDGSEKPYRLIYVIPSKKFTKEFGEINWLREYNSSHPFTKVIHDPKADKIVEGEVELVTQDGKRVITDYEAWTNSYNVFVLIKKKQKTFYFEKEVAFKTPF